MHTLFVRARYIDPAISGLALHVSSVVLKDLTVLYNLLHTFLDLQRRYSQNSHCPLASARSVGHTVQTS